MTQERASKAKTRPGSLNAVFEALNPGSSVFVGSACSEPQELVEVMLDHADGLSDIRVITGVFGSDVPYLDERLRKSFRLMTVMSSRQVADAIGQGYADYLPSSLYNTDKLIKAGCIPLDLAMVQVSTPDPEGMCSLGVNVGYNRAAITAASTVIAEVNARMPRTRGDTLIHESAFDHVVESDRPLLEVPFGVNVVDEAIGRRVAGLIYDGDTVHVGVGSLGQAIFSALSGHEGLRIHTGSISDPIITFAESGALASSPDQSGRGPVVAGQCIGTTALYEYVDENPSFWFDDPSTTHNPLVLGSIKSFISVNSALQVDLRGQANAESLRGKQVAGIGGSIDYASGARLSPGGLSVVAIRSSTSSGEPRIVPRLDSSVVTLPSSLVDVVVTENGVADLRGLTLKERAESIASIASPTARDFLTRRLDAEAKRQEVYDFTVG